VDGTAGEGTEEDAMDGIHHVAKLGVAGSNPVSLSRETPGQAVEGAPASSLRPP